MANKKMTKKEMFTEILNSYNLTADHKALIEKTIEQLEKKSANAHNGDKKPTAKQLENDGLKEKILEFLTENTDEKFTVTDIWKKVPALAENSEMSNQRVSSLIRQLTLDNLVVREEIKRKAYFSIVK